MSRLRSVLFSLGLTLVLGLITLLGQAGASAADPGVLYVAPGGNCGGVTPCYATVQAAVDAAGEADEIRVSQGTYAGVSARAGVTQSVYISKTVTIRGGYATSDWASPNRVARETTLDAQGLGRVLYVSGEIAPVFEGLRITGGDATGLAGHGYNRADAGGGIYVHTASAVVSGCTVIGNGASTSGEGHGGGVYLWRSSSTLRSNLVQSNSASIENAGLGGGVSVWNSAATLEYNIVASNTAVAGAGIAMLYDSDATLTGNTIDGNSNEGGWGGGVLSYASSPTLAGNVITGNSAATNRGGGMQLYAGRGTLLGNRFSSNSASQGGGLSLEGGTHTLVNNVVVDNQAGRAPGILVLGASAQMLHSTVAHNAPGGGVGITVEGAWWGEFYPAALAMTNTIIAGQSTGLRVTESCTVTALSTLWHGNGTDSLVEGTLISSSDLHGDPAFDSDGYHLLPWSLAIDRGLDAGTTVDLDGDERPQGVGHDLGADEFLGTVTYRRLYLPLAVGRQAHGGS